VLGFPQLEQDFIYFNRTDVSATRCHHRYLLTPTQVQKAIHAPDVNWDICSEGNVYAGTGRDQSIPSTLSVLPNVIEKSERVLIVHGLLVCPSLIALPLHDLYMVQDFILLAEGTRIAIQNMTWAGAQGFQSPIEPESFVVPGFGVYGNAHTERNLTYVEFYYSGHMTPQFVPWASYQTIEYLLGRRPSVSA
jgi:carboxypeptidase D